MTSARTTWILVAKRQVLWKESGMRKTFKIGIIWGRSDSTVGNMFALLTANPGSIYGIH